ncbi:hypothetical protein ABPG72_013591 [Tetrahymena utriculariae]
MKVEPLSSSEMPPSSPPTPSQALNSQIQNKNIRKTMQVDKASCLGNVSVQNRAKQKKLPKQKQKQKYSPSKIMESQKPKPRSKSSSSIQQISNCSGSVLNTLQEEEETPKLIKCDTLFTRRLLAIGDHILDFSDDIQKKRPNLFVSVQLHPHNPRLGFIQFKSSTQLKVLEELLLNDNSNKYKKLLIRPVEKMNNWKRFFDSPNNFFPDYKNLSTELGQTGELDFDKAFNTTTTNTYNQDFKNSINVGNQKTMKNGESVQLQMETNLKQEDYDDCCILQQGMQQLQPAQIRSKPITSYENDNQNQNSNEEEELLLKAITTSSILNSNSNSDNNSNSNNNTNKNQSPPPPYFRTQLNLFNQNQKKLQQPQIFLNQPLYKCDQQVSQNPQANYLESNSVDTVIRNNNKWCQNTFAGKLHICDSNVTVK